MKKQGAKRKKRIPQKSDSSASRPDSQSRAHKAGKSSGRQISQVLTRRELEKRGQEKKGLASYIQITLQFLREARMELKKVKWPTRKELLASTGAVIFLVLILSLFLGIIDFGLIKIIKTIVG
jgi:preprotein translocase subunit SecE